MKWIFLGIKDYVKDCWHDYVLIPRWVREEKCCSTWLLGKYVKWKEGSVWHYIRQRRIAKRNKKMKQKLTEWHISDYIKTDEDVHNLLAAEREPYENALRTALVILGEISEMTDSEVAICDPRDVAKRWRRAIIKGLKDEGIPDPTELKDKK